MVVFSLTRWSSHIPTGFLVSRRTLDTPSSWTISPTGLLPSFAVLSSTVRLSFLNGLWSPSPQKYYYSWFGLFRFRSPLLSESLFYFLFLWVIRCFSSPGSLHYTIYSCNDTIILLMVSSLIRISTDHGLFATPRSFSQLVTSFFGAMYQGILLYALCSLIFFFNCISNLRRIITFFLDYTYSTNFFSWIVSYVLFRINLSFSKNLSNFALCLNVLFFN